jgi:hypothetical protein
MAEDFEFINGDVHLSDVNCAAFGKFAESLSELRSNREGKRNFSYGAVSAGCLSCMKKVAAGIFRLAINAERMIYVPANRFCPLKKTHSQFHFEFIL